MVCGLIEMLRVSFLFVFVVFALLNSDVSQKYQNCVVKHPAIKQF